MTKRKITVRRMRAGDEKEVSRMFKALAALSGDDIAITEHDLHAYCLGRQKFSTVFLALVSKQPAGFAISHDWRNFYIGIIIRHIDFIFVEENHRGSGIGSALLKTIAFDAIKAGCQRLDIDAAMDNEVANELYKKLGFQSHVANANHYRLWEPELRNLSQPV